MEKYENLGLVGEGSYGMVLKCRHKDTNQLVAIKKFLESEDDKMVKKIAMREVKMLKQLRHDHLVNLIEVFRRKKRLYLVFEFVDHTVLDELEKCPTGLDHNTCRKILWQVLKGTEFCHQHHIIHRDIKPENVLISKNGIVKICDFGFARTLAQPGETYTDYVATRWYRAPELLVGDTKYGKAVDIWAVGCLLSEMLSGEPLFPGDSDIDQLYHIIKCFGNLTPRHREVFLSNPLFVGMRIPEVREVQPLERKFTKFSPESIDFMKQCLRLEPDNRPTCSELVKHSLFTDDGFSTRFPQELQQKLHKERASKPHAQRRTPDQADHRDPEAGGTSRVGPHLGAAGAVKKKKKKSEAFVKKEPDAFVKKEAPGVKREPDAFVKKEAPGVKREPLGVKKEPAAFKKEPMGAHVLKEAKRQSLDNHTDERKKKASVGSIITTTATATTTASSSFTGLATTTTTATTSDTEVSCSPSLRKTSPPSNVTVANQITLPPAFIKEGEGVGPVTPTTSPMVSTSYIPPIYGTALAKDPLNINVVSRVSPDKALSKKQHVKKGVALASANPPPHTHTFSISPQPLLHTEKSSIHDKASDARGGKQRLPPGGLSLPEVKGASAGTDGNPRTRKDSLQSLKKSSVASIPQLTTPDSHNSMVSNNTQSEQSSGEASLASAQG